MRLKNYTVNINSTMQFVGPTFRKTFSSIGMQGGKLPKCWAYLATLRNVSYYVIILIETISRRKS